jgi:hypothetical protein
VLPSSGNIGGYFFLENDVRPVVNQTQIGFRWSSSSSTRWKSRQGKDIFAREARVQGLKSRAAFKLLEVGILSSVMAVLTLIGRLRLTPSIRYSKEARLLSI